MNKNTAVQARQRRAVSGTQTGQERLTPALHFRVLRAVLSGGDRPGAVRAAGGHAAVSSSRLLRLTLRDKLVKSE